MAFLQPEYYEGDWYVVETSAGSFAVPAELLDDVPKEHVDICDKCGESTTDIDAGFCPSLHEMGHCQGGTWRRREVVAKALAPYVEGDVQSFEKKRAVGVRLSAPGYLDSTEWTLHSTTDEARQHLLVHENVNPDTGEDIFEEKEEDEEEDADEDIDF